MAKKKKAMTTAPAAPAPASKGPDGNATTYLIALGILLALFAGTVVLLLSTPKGKELLGRAPAPSGVEGPAANAPAMANGNANVPPPGPALNEMGLPEGGRVELVDTLDADGVMVVDQKVVWRSESGDITLVEHASDLLPALKEGSSALGIVGRPSGSTRVIFAFGCAGGCDAPGLYRPMAFDPALRAFIPLINAPDHYIGAGQLSPNERRMWFTGPSDDIEQRELWVYDFVNDKQTLAIRLPNSETLTAYEPEIGPKAVTIRWVDPTQLEYKVYRASAAVPSYERPRTEIATRTASVPQ